MLPSTLTDRELWRGALAFLVISAFCAAVVTTIVYARPWQRLIDAEISSLAERNSPARAKREAPSAPSGVRAPAGMPMLHGMGYSPPPSEGDAGTPGGGGTDGSSALAATKGDAPGASQALRDVLKAYRSDPRHTSTVILTTQGHIARSGKSTVSVLDGLSPGEITGATEIAGGAPAR